MKLWEKRKMTETEKSVSLAQLMSFNRILYLKNMIRFAAYIGWFFLFLLGWLNAFMGGAGKIFIGTIAFGCFMAQYSAMSFMNNDENRRVILPLRRFFGVDAGRIWLSRVLRLLPCLLILMGMLLVQTALEITIWRFDLLAGAEGMLLLAFLAASLTEGVIVLFS